MVQIKLKKLHPAPSATLKTYLIVTGMSLCHMFVSFNLYIFFLLRLHSEGFFFTRNVMEVYVTNGHKTMILSALPEFLVFPPTFAGVLLTYFYTLILYHQFFDKNRLLAKQRMYTRYSLVTPFPHAIFIIFFTIDGLVIYLAAEKGLTRQNKNYYLIILSVGSVFNAAWMIALAIYFPPFVRYRQDLVNAEKLLLRETRERLLMASNAMMSEHKRIGSPRPKRQSFHS